MTGRIVSSKPTRGFLFFLFLLEAVAIIIVVGLAALVCLIRREHLNMETVRLQCKLVIFSSEKKVHLIS